MRQYTEETPLTLEQVRDLREEQSKQFHRLTQQSLRKMWARQAEAENRVEAGFVDGEDYAPDSDN